MAEKKGPGMDWFTIRYEHIFKIGGFILALAVVGGGGWALFSHLGSPKTKASNKLADARKIINVCGELIEEQNRLDLGKRLQSAKLMYEEGEHAFRKKEYQKAKNHAIDSENLSLEIKRDLIDISTLADVSAIEGVVEIQRSGQHVFERLSKGAKLSEGDTIKTSAGSVCRISYMGGTQITIGEDTLYVIKRLTRERVDGILDGTADFELVDGSKVRIIDDKGTLDLVDKSDALVENKGEVFTVNLFGGDASLTDHTGVTSNLTGGQSASVTESGTIIEKLPEAPEPQTPANYYTFNEREPTSLELILSWTQMGDTGFYEVQLSPRPLFSQTIDLGKFGQSVTSQAEISGLPAGVYYWRVRRQNLVGKFSKWSPAHKFTIKKVDNDRKVVLINLKFDTKPIGSDLVLINGKTDAGMNVIVDNIQIEVEPSGEFSHLHTRTKLTSDFIEIQACDNQGRCTELKKHKAW